ncbi:MAG: hypothetical protein OHK0013_00900 [Sandaracinaceae bacterium]
MTRRPSAALSLALCGALGLFAAVAPTTASAHGREPGIGAVAFDPSDRAHFVLRGTWALLSTRDDGESFTWTCAVAADFDRLTEDPAVVVTESGRVVLGTFDGLRRSTERGCDYEDGPAEVRGAYAIDVQPDPRDPRAVWVAYSPGDRPNTILRSVDEGATFEVMAELPAGLLVERLRLAASDPMRVYASGAVPRSGEEPRRAFFLRSTDGGRTFAPREIPLLSDEERNVHVVAVDPSDADRVLVRVTRRVTDPLPERLLLTEDGGDSFRTVLEIREIVAAIFSHDGAHAWAGSWYGGLHRSDDGGRTFAAIDADLRVRCLAERASERGDGELFVCVDELTEDYAVARSYDLGATLEPMWGFADITNDVGCDVCTQVGATCPAYWPDVVFDLALLGGVDGGPPPPPLDAGPPPICGEGGVSLDASMDAAVGGGTGGGGCACLVTGTRVGSGAQGAFFAAVVIAWAGRRRARSRAEGHERPPGRERERARAPRDEPPRGPALGPVTGIR